MAADILASIFSTMGFVLRGERMTTEERIAAEYDRLKALSIAKNQAYGDSAVNPVRIFSKVDPIEGLKVRLDDKLARIQRGDVDAFGENPYDDIVGYCVLILVVLGMKEGQ
jgi:hypothetical protein